MKRKATDPAPTPKAKRQREPEPDYCDAKPQRAEDGSIIWPASESAIENARQLLRECAAAQSKVLIVPDKDADGLSSGVIIYRTLTKLGLPASHIDVHLVQKGANIYDEAERAAMQDKQPKYIIVVDQGSKAAPPVVESAETKSLIIDHHMADEFPKDAMIVSACYYPPVATSALLTYEICKPLHEDISSACGYLCTIGTLGDLGTSLKWKPPFPSMTETFKKHTKKAITDAVSLINAPRRTAKYDVSSAWHALLDAQDPKALLTHPRLLAARAEINAEVERQTHTPPKFSADGKIAVLRIHSAAQVHPVIATRWAGHLRSKALEIVMVANSGYLPGFVNFSCRIARCAKGRDPPVNIIETLKEVAGREGGGLLQRLGETNFARGHREASGGIVPVGVFEELVVLMGVGEKAGGGEVGTRKGEKDGSPQKNNLLNYFKK